MIQISISILNNIYIICTNLPKIKFTLVWENSKTKWIVFWNERSKRKTDHHCNIHNTFSVVGRLNGICWRNLILELNFKLMSTEKLSDSEYLRIPPTRRESLERREALNRRIMMNIPVVEEDSWKLARQDRDLRALLSKK